MALSEAIPITATAWVSQAQPILRRASRRSRQDSCSYGYAGNPDVGADSVRNGPSPAPTQR
ncbi:hypothetical protein PCLA_09f0184 [Pseudomonas citronellolis]|nr:hypothetical protein PCLA_09f0184 [Pseudomonas citronellolis]